MDDAVREAERRFRASGSVDDEPAWLEAKELALQREHDRLRRRIVERLRAGAPTPRDPPPSLLGRLRGWLLC